MRNIGIALVLGAAILSGCTKAEPPRQFSQVALDQALAATADLAVTVAYASTVLPFPADEVRALAAGRREIAIVEPYLAGTSTAALADALRDEPRRLLALGVPPIELRRYGRPKDHRRAYGLDAAGIRRSLDAFLPGAAAAA